MKNSVKDLTLMAMYAALFIVLDYLANFLPKMPYGGSIGLGVIALLMASYHLGWEKGLMIGFISIPLQYITGQIWFVHWIQFALDYVFAFAIYGIACIFPNIKIGNFELYIGVIITNVIRYCSSVISGVVFWGEQGASLKASLLYSLQYNASYMIPTLLLTLIVIPMLYKRITPLIK